MRRGPPAEILAELRVACLLASRQAGPEGRYVAPSPALPPRGRGRWLCFACHGGSLRFALLGRLRFACLAELLSPACGAFVGLLEWLRCARLALLNCSLRPAALLLVFLLGFARLAVAYLPSLACEDCIGPLAWLRCVRLALLTCPLRPAALSSVCLAGLAGAPPPLSLSFLAPIATLPCCAWSYGLLHRGCVAWRWNLVVGGARAGWLSGSGLSRLWRGGSRGRRGLCGRLGR